MHCRDVLDWSSRSRPAICCGRRVRPICRVVRGWPCAGVGAAGRNASEQHGDRAGASRVRVRGLAADSARQVGSEQNVDRLFNVAMVAAVVLVVGGVAALLRRRGAGVCRSVWIFLKDSTAKPRRRRADRGHYVAAIGFCLGAREVFGGRTDACNSSVGQAQAPNPDHSQRPNPKTQSHTQSNRS